ncbi:MAG: aminoglycoside phosphotransferase family protein [Ardenticatenaceae bacterium]|nr:aminoglycoside phosphotransferase family protein [Anaerolineales bacterium]MCB8921324.1 aminoglycoside phosphotransferase family protein [Ardenticatenaceae bacterium]MCB8990686.1 aminoglycoside phosphotransferase family protein [Ardenticatenaceae bacterium]MCB9004053.1 aminoglycoside phosphotransferase family protein [Ardenticatenaceae bacterium]
MTSFLPPINNWSDWSAMFTDAALWQPVVRRICRQHGLTAGTVKAGFPGTCAVFVVDEQVVVKLYPPMLPQDFLREREVYQTLQHPFLPPLLGDGVYADRIEWPYLLLSFRAGRPIREVFDEIAPAQRLALGQELGTALRQLHAAPISGLRHFEMSPQAWQRQLRQNAAANLAKLRDAGYLTAVTINELAEMMQGWQGERPSSPLHLLNADLTEDHLLLRREAGRWRIAALIDWADAEVGTAVYDWIALWYSLCRRDAAFFRAILHAYDPTLRLDAAFRRQLFTYTFLHRFGAAIVDYLWQQDMSTLRSLADLEEWLVGSLSIEG